jgi:very-short-patch-repair endonuclease
MKAPLQGANREVDMNNSNGEMRQLFEESRPGRRQGDTNADEAPLLHRLAGYYRDLLFSLYSTSSVGKHFIDVSGVLRHKLTADLGLFIESFQELIEGNANTFSIEKLTPAAVSKVVSESETAEEADRTSGNGNGVQETLFDGAEALKNASAAVIAIYRRQQFDPFNREVIVGFPLISGQIGGKKYCAPLLYFTSRIDFDPLHYMVTVTKEHSVPALNFHFLKQVLQSDEAIETVRKQIIAHLYEDDFSACTVKKIVEKLARLNLVEGLSSVSFEPSAEMDLMSDAIRWRDRQPPKVFNTVVIVNAHRSNPYLLDDLTQLTRIEIPEGATAVDRILNPPPDRDLSMDIERDPATSLEAGPLLYPLPSNRAQRQAAVKAEKAQLMAIQGPPGTGKSQTIVNLASHLIAQGKTVLISSHQNKALEVITNNLPRVDYLAMSLFKGEAQSLVELLTRIEGLSAHVSGQTAEGLSARLEERMGRLRQNDIDIKRLSVRFSELKKIERDKYPMYRKYHDLRPYELILGSDSIPDGMDSEIARALGKYKQLLEGLSDHLRDLSQIFSPDGRSEPVFTSSRPDGQSDIPSKSLGGVTKEGAESSRLWGSTAAGGEGIEAVRNSLEELIEAYEWAKTNVFCEGRVRDRCKAFASLSQDVTALARQMERLSMWTREYLSGLKRSMDTLAAAHGIAVELPKVRADILKHKIMMGKFKEMMDRNREILATLSATIPDPAYPDRPDTAALAKAAGAITALETAGRSWLSWRFGSDARTARRDLSSANFPAIPYRGRKEGLDRLKSWYRYWSHTNDVVTSLRVFAEAGFPFDPPAKESSLSALTTCLSIAHLYTDIVEALVNYPSSVDGRITELVDDEIGQAGECRISEKCLAMATKYIEYVAAILSYRQNSHVDALFNTTLGSVAEALINIQSSDEADRTALWLKSLQEHFSGYEEMRKLEAGPLKTLPITCRYIKERFTAGESILQLDEPDKVVNAFRLSNMVKDDLVKNPDDINEVATRMAQLRKETFAVILKTLDLQRKLGLKKASSNPATMSQLSKLKHVLKRKRKTHSFMHLRDQIDYEKLLSVFPCWIMSIDDVGRIFPLRAGLFDYLIVDEASQCNQATVLPLAFRAKRMVVVGDEKQMKNPNTQFLSDTVVQLHLTKHGLDTHYNEPFLRGRNSLLDLALGCQDIDPVFLNEHFRSEPPIIQFSNKHFYDGRLSILTPFRRRRFTPCMEIRHVPGASDDPEETRRNVVEAKAVISELVDLVDSGRLEGDNPGEYLSVGILSLFRAQATLLQSLVYEAFADRPGLIERHRIAVSTVDGFQGDERDVILYSFRYASNSKPGSITAVQRSSDEHSLGRLNVAFSRARRKAVCFTSVPVQHFPQGLVRSYLEHARLEQQRSRDRLGDANERRKCQSEFEEHVFDDLVKAGLTVYAQVPCAGFFIDFVVRDPEGRRLAVECDGDFHYEDGELREEDYQRQDIIERYGWVVYRIPSRRYYTHPERTIEDLLRELTQKQPDEEVIIQQDGTGTETKDDHVSATPATFHEPQVAIDGRFAEADDNAELQASDNTAEKQEEKKGFSTLPTTFQEDILDLLTNEGPMPVWRISDRIKQYDKPKIQQQIEAMALRGWIECIAREGVKMWRAID